MGVTDQLILVIMNLPEPIPLTDIPRIPTKACPLAPERRLTLTLVFETLITQMH